MSYTPHVRSPAGVRSHMTALRIKTLIATLIPPPTARPRTLRMSSVWAVLGAVMGASFGIEGGGILGAITGMLVGISELAPIGAIFARIGGRPHETILGSVGGLLGGLAVGMMGGQAPVVLLANVGLFVGAIVGATLDASVRVLSLPINLLGAGPGNPAGGRDATGHTAVS
jgi:hypothetical protein